MAKTGMKPDPPIEGPEDIGPLLERAAKGDASTLPALRAMFEGRADLVRAFGGDKAWTAEKSMVESAAGEHVAIKEAMHRRLGDIRAELAGPDPSPMERLLAERAALCWFWVHQFEAIYAQQRGNLNLDQAENLQRRIDRAHKRYLASLRTLAMIRKLALPTIQVNVADKQINLAGSR